jgi:branched-chain amino acid transport system substrate-binding protein
VGVDRRLRASLGSVLVVVLVASCGTRLSRAEFEAQNPGRAQVGAEAERTEDVGATAEGDVTPTDATDGVEVAEPGGAVAAAAGQAGGAVRASGAAPTATKKPIVIGLVGYFSGIGAPVHVPKRDAFLAWARAVNARGGINGHQVQLLVGDDAGNDSRAVSIARDFVENKGAIVLSVSGSTEDGAIAYATSKRIPVVGISAAGSDTANPLVFPTGAGSRGFTWGTAALAKAAGKSKVGMIYCAESKSCQTTSDEYATAARELGLQVVFSARASVAQPDYTAECIQAMRSGVEVLFVVADNASPVRMARSCGRQNFRPVWQLASASDSQGSVPELEGALAASDAFPWVLRSGGPGIDEYVRGLEQFASHLLTKGARDQASAWLTAKVIEKAAAKVGVQPTSAEILEGLWAMRGETLDGLMPGKAAISYERDRRVAESFCVFGLRLQGGRWVAVNGLTPVCR